MGLCKQQMGEGTSSRSASDEWSPSKSSSEGFTDDYESMPPPEVQRETFPKGADRDDTESQHSPSTIPSTMHTSHSRMLSACQRVW